MAKKNKSKADPAKTYADNAEVITEATIIGERHGITLTAMPADALSGVTAHIRAQSKNSAVWRVFRRHQVNGSTGEAIAYYHIKDLRGWEVGHAKTLVALYTLLSKADKAMGEIWKQEHAEALLQQEIEQTAREEEQRQ